MSDTCKHGMEVCEPCAFDRGRQAQYELMRAGNCEHGFYIERCKLIAVKDIFQSCPTDYRECPLKQGGKE